MCVCFVIENLLPAGTELWVVRLIERLDRRRIQPVLCLTDGRSHESHRLAPTDCPTLRLQLPHLKSHRTLSAAHRFYRFLRTHRVDVVQVHHADPTYLGVPVARLAAVPTIVQTKYDVGYWLEGFDLWMHRRLRRWIDVTVANCEACRQAAIAQERAPAEEVVVIENGIETDRLSTIASVTGDDWGGTVHVGMLANLRPIKDPQNLVRAALELIRQQHPVMFQFGGEGPQREPMQRTITQAGLQDRILLHGHVADSVEFLKQLQIFVLCSLSEGLPHALLEAMAAGRAVVATNVGGNRELIQHGVNGLLVPPGDSSALAAAIGRLVREPELAVRLAAAAHRSVTDRFSLPAMTHRFSEFYQRLPTRSPARTDVPLSGQRSENHGATTPMESTS